MGAASPRSTRLRKLLALLRKQHGPADLHLHPSPYPLLLQEQVAYLADDEQRAQAFAALRSEIGLEPERILAAPAARLEAVARLGGGIAVAKRAARLREVAARVQRDWNGRLEPILQLPLEQARRALAQFPAIGPPGAEKILLLCGAQPVLALDSNGLRVLLRLGYGQEQRNYAASYRSAQEAASAELPLTIDARREAYELLRRHGQTLCRRSHPQCPVCPLRRDCPAAGNLGAAGAPPAG